MGKKEKKNKSGYELTSLAWFVSRLFDPVLIIPLLLSSAVIYAVQNGWRSRYLVFLLLIDAVGPAIFMFWGLMTKRFSDWDMTKREERRDIYIFTVMMHFFGVIYAYMLGKEDLAEILFVFWLIAFVFAVVTMFWKISIHAGVCGAAVAFFNHFWGWQNYWWLVVVLLVVLWARVRIKKHTWAQVLVGAGSAVMIVEYGMRLVGR